VIEAEEIRNEPTTSTVVKIETDSGEQINLIDNTDDVNVMFDERYSDMYQANARQWDRLGRPRTVGGQPRDTYKQRIMTAIKSSPTGSCCLVTIYKFLKNTWPEDFPKDREFQWKNSVRHNLSLHKSTFYRVKNDNMKPNEWACFNEHGEPEIPSLIPMQPGEKRKPKPRRPLKSRASSGNDMELGSDRIWDPLGAFVNEFPSGLSLIQHVNEMNTEMNTAHVSAIANSQEFDDNFPTGEELVGMQNDELKKQLTQFKGQLASKDARIASRQDRIHQQDKEIQRLCNRNKTTDKQIRALKLRIANLEIQLAEKDISISELRSDLAKERKKILENESFD